MKAALFHRQVRQCCLNREYSNLQFRQYTAIRRNALVRYAQKPSLLAPITTRHLRRLHDARLQEDLTDDQRVQKLGKAYHDEYRNLKVHYDCPKHPIVLCHGLLGFDSMRIGEIEPLNIPPLAVIHYWKGIKEALEANGNEVFITRVPRSGSVEDRAAILANQIQEHFGGRSINLIGHSMVRGQSHKANSRVAWTAAISYPC